MSWNPVRDRAKKADTTQQPSAKTSWDKTEELPFIFECVVIKIRMKYGFNWHEFEKSSAWEEPVGHMRAFRPQPGAPDHEYTVSIINGAVFRNGFDKRLGHGLDGTLLIEEHSSQLYNIKKKMLVRMYYSSNVHYKDIKQPGNLHMKRQSQTLWSQGIIAWGDICVLMDMMFGDLQYYN